MADTTPTRVPRPPSDPSPSEHPSSGPTWLERIERWPLGVIALVLVSYVPLLLTRPGVVGADTKTYLYLDPARLLSRAPYMWDPNVGLGTVTHQNIGYLWPMGPYYWLLDTIGLPDWVAQRLWLGSIILAAGLGVRWMLKELRWNATGATVAAFAYALSPYLLDYGARLSVILLPFAGLPWLIGLAARSLRRDDWRTPAVFALVTLTVGGVNATSLVLVMIGPLMWFVYATFVEREVPLRRTIVTGLRITVLTLVTSLWWLAGLMIQGTHGIPILRYTETYETVANAALAPELMRGLGYWFFYGTDGLGAWTEATVGLIEMVPLLFLSFLLPGLAIVAGLFTRWKHRVFFASIIAVGLVVAVGAHPWEGPSPYGALFKAFTQGDLGLSFRSTPRAVPLIALGLAVFLGAGVGALSRRRPSWHLPVAGTLIVLICINQAALFRGQMVDRNLKRDEEIPEYWLEAAAALDAGDRDTRVLEVPGIDFASYRWGNTVDPITPGLTDREYAARELIPYGTPPSANLMNDVDMPFQSGRVDPAAIAPLARLMGVGDVVLRGDLQFERYRTPRPRTTYGELLRAAGLDAPISFGAPVPNEAADELPLDDEMSFGIPSSAPDPAPVSIFPVEDARPVLRTTSAAAPTVLSGDGSGLVALASIGRLPADRPVFYSASFAEDTDALVDLVDEPDAELVVSDTNRRQARRWGAVRDNDGYTEVAGEQALVEDNTDNRLDVFPDEGDDQRTIVEQLGGTRAAASRYGNGVTYTASDRAANAVDGDPATAWRVAAFDDAVDEFLQIEVDEPVTADHLDLLQVQGAKNRHITRVGISFDGGEPLEVDLDETSRTPPGQRIEFPERSFETLRITILATDPGELASYKGISDVGLAEVVVEGVEPIVEVVRPPVDLLEAVGDDAIDRPLTYLFTRRAAKPSDVIAGDEEPTMRRWIIGPDTRDYRVYGSARLDVGLGDAELDEFLGLGDGVRATSSARLPGDPRSRASAAVDGDESTAYQTPLGAPAGNWIELTYPEPVTVTDLPVSIVADGLHSVPTSLGVSVDGAAPVSYPLGPIELGEGRPRGSTTRVDVPTGPLTGRTFRISIDAVTEAESKDWFGGARTVLPAGIAEVGLPVVEAPSADAAVPDRCRSDLVAIDGEPVPVQLQGTVGEALSGDPLDLHMCAASGAGAGDASVEVPGGEVLLETFAPDGAEVDVDLLALSSAAGGGPGVDTLETPLDDGPPPPDTTTDRTGRNSYSADVTAADEPYWVVLGQSFGPGWSARTSDGVDLGEPTLVNGYANGWRVDPAEVGADATIEISWTPQRYVWIGLAASAVGVLICLALIVFGRRRREDDSDPAGAVDVELVNDLDDEAAHVAEAAGRSAVAAALPARMTPELVGPLEIDGNAWTPGRAALAGLVVAAIGTFAAGPFVGVALGVVAGLALGLRRGQAIVRAACLAMFVAAFGFIVAKQWRVGYSVDFDWMNSFEITHAWGMFATLALLLAVVVDDLRRR